MLISLALHLILLMFELLVCDKLSSGRHLWILVFVPLIFVGIVSIALCIWALKHDRSFEVFIFSLSYRLSHLIDLFLAGAFLRGEHTSICFFSVEVRRFHILDVGSSIRPFLDIDVLELSW
jgi:hypothetical protein